MNDGLTIYSKRKLELCYEAGKDGYMTTISFLESSSVGLFCSGMELCKSDPPDSDSDGWTRVTALLSLCFMK